MDAEDGGPDPQASRLHPASNRSAALATFIFQEKQDEEGLLRKGGQPKVSPPPCSVSEVRFELTTFRA